MAAPSAYTEESLAEYAHQAVRSLAEKIGWVPQEGFYTEVINEVLLALGVANIATIAGDTAVRQLRAVTRRETWKAVMGELAARHAFSADFQVFSRQQMFDMAKQMYGMAVVDCAELGVDSAAYQIRVGTLVYVQDPYVPYEQIDPNITYKPWP